MNITVPLYEAEHICLGPIDYETDPALISKWSQNAEYLRLMAFEPAMPISTAKAKKQLEALEKEIDENKNGFSYTIRMRSENQDENGRLIGVARIYWIEWTNGCGNLRLGIGDAADRGKGYGSEALGLLLRFAFDELNLYRLGACVGEYNTAALRLLTKAGFVEEARQRQALNRVGRRWDIINLGLLSEEWHVLQGGR